MTYSPRVAQLMDMSYRHAAHNHGHELAATISCDHTEALAWDQWSTWCFRHADAGTHGTAEEMRLADWAEAIKMDRYQDYLARVS